MFFSITFILSTSIYLVAMEYDLEIISCKQMFNCAADDKERYKRLKMISEIYFKIVYTYINTLCIE